MWKTLWKVGLTTAAVVLLSSSSAYAQLATQPINAQAVVAPRGRITLTGAISFPDRDPVTDPTIDAAGLGVQAFARVAVGAGVSLTVQAGGNFVSPTASIPIGNLSWATTGDAGFNAGGTMSSTTAQPVGNWTGPGAHNATQTYRLVNDWAYAPGTYNVTLTYTLTSP